MSNRWTSPLASLTTPLAGFLASGCNGSTAYLTNQYHIGADFRGSSNEAVYALGAGTVIRSQSFADGYGTYVVVIQHTAPDGSPFIAVYGHLNVAGLPAVGATVQAGTQIGTLNPNAENGPHLHLGIVPGTSFPLSNWGNMPCSSWPNANGFVDPIPWLDAHPVPNPLAVYANHIVKWTDGTAWLVGPDLRRRWIKDGRTYNCLTARGVPVSGVLDSGTLDALTDMTGVRAQCPPGDVNTDGTVNIVDLSYLLSNYGSSASNVGYNGNTDLNDDGQTDVTDLSIMLSHWGLKG